jgi:hypothetical protein
MRVLIFLGVFLLSKMTNAQTILGGETNKTKSSKSVSFIAKIDTLLATKDGIYLNGYVVNINRERIWELNGKTIQVEGKVTIIKAIKPNNGGEVEQGRSVDTKHIISPKITILKN